MIYIILCFGYGIEKQLLGNEVDNFALFDALNPIHEQKFRKRWNVVHIFNTRNDMQGCYAVVLNLLCRAKGTEGCYTVFLNLLCRAKGTGLPRFRLKGRPKTSEPSLMRNLKKMHFHRISK